MKVLLVEDEYKLTQALEFLLKKENIDADIANDGEEGLMLAEKDIYDVIILDIMLPFVSGLEILSHIRKKNIMTPVLMLTAKDTIEDRVFGLESGADDYLVKPFDTKELLARIKALSRRKTEFISKYIEFKDVKYDSENLMLIVKNEKNRLSKKEGALIEILLKRPNQIFSRDKIIDRLWGLDSDVLENNIEIYIHNLRKKLEESNVKIETIRGIGYMVTEK